MKKLSILLFFVTIGLMSFGQLTGSAHDFNDGAGLGNDAWNTMASNKMCGPCHTPHNASQAASGPLWSHTLSTAVFTIYTSPFNTMEAVPGQPSGVSLYCLSCHDGTVNLNDHDYGTSADAMTGTALVGTDLSDDHPVSFAWDGTFTDPELYDPTTQLSGLPAGGTITTDMLFSGTLQCGSCHDVHNYAGIPGLLLKTNISSELCLTCHNK
ncbi:MAG: cytochrome c3 family protein [Bacteroidales bacterium]|nr:cytochrome c3 family protein [Bacteroidales bacterium]